MRVSTLDAFGAISVAGKNHPEYSLISRHWTLGVAFGRGMDISGTTHQLGLEARSHFFAGGTVLLNVDGGL